MINQCPTCSSEVESGDFESWVGRSELQSRCASLSSDINNQPEVSEELHAANKPGGAANPTTDAQGWLWYLCWLHRMQAGSPLNATKTRPQLTKYSEEEAEVMRDAFSETPVFVPMSDGQTRGVYPKSDYALQRVGYIDSAYEYVMRARLALELAEPSPESLAAMQRTIDASAQLEREFAWIAAHHEPGLPWEEDGSWEHEPPTWTQQLQASDYPLLRAAYSEVNFRRFSVLSDRTHQLKRRGDSDGMTNEAFVAAMASELGISVRDAMRNYSKCGLAVQALLKWETMLKAEEKADAKAAAR